MPQIEIVRDVIQKFCVDFVDHPYRCYTEHGLHALLFTRLFNALGEEACRAKWNEIEVCTIQKEYPTAHDLDKPKRQHWDLALIKEPVKSLREGERQAYDYFKLAAAIEVGLNEPAEHLKEDIRRLLHKKANVKQGFALHLYRLAERKMKISRRDWSNRSSRILSVGQADDILTEAYKDEHAADREIEIVYAITGATGKYEKGAWSIRRDKTTRLG